MSDERDELAWDVFSIDNAAIPDKELRKDFPHEADYAFHIAEGLIEAGYRKPRQVTTVEELDALPLRSIVMNDGSNPHAWQKRTDVHVGDAWYLTSDTDYGMDSYAIFEDGESATVLYVPEPTT